MKKTLAAALVLLGVVLAPALLAHAEDASVLLKRYGLSIYDREAEVEKLGSLEEEYQALSYKVNTNTMLTTAEALHEQNTKNQLMAMDKELYNLEDQLSLLEMEMGNSKERAVSYLLELDGKYRSLASALSQKRGERARWIAQDITRSSVPVQAVEQDKETLEVLGSQLNEQREHVDQAVVYAELGEITRFRSPVSVNAMVTSPFGWRLDPVTRQAMAFHSGLDIGVPQDTPVLAAFNGTVEEAAAKTEIGNYVLINHGNGIRTLYGHLKSSHVRKGQEVRQYESIALSGNSGTNTTGPHLHFGVLINGQPVDPAVFALNQQ